MDTYWTNPANFRASRIKDIADRSQVAAAVADFRLATLCVLDGILKRYERNADYPFIDTKLSLLTGRDFPDADILRGKRTIFGWIQGRGLEALVGHDAWLMRQGDIEPALRRSFHERIVRAVGQVMAACERIRLACGGRLAFMMDRDGGPLMVGPDGAVVPGPSRVGKPTCTTEMFYCKGLAAAAWLLGDEAALGRARELFEQVYDDLQAGRFSSDQQQLDPRNAVLPTPGKLGHGARMVGIGAATCFLQCTGAARYREIGLEWIRYVLDHHVNTAPGKRGELYDMWENTDLDHKQLMEGGVLKSDPGHACEFVGLALKFLSVVQDRLAPREGEVELVAGYQRLLPLVLKQNFANGFSPRGFGMVKAFDLLGRKPINDQMPWWPLPETIRAAAGAMRVAPPEQRGEYAGIAAACSNAFLAHYVRPELGLMAYQTLGPDGKPVDVIPATPDADPGYHTGLSIIDALEILDIVR